MPELDKIEDTLFVPMLGRIYASENFPNILKDDKALELKPKLPKDIKGQDTQTQYTFMSGAVRSANMDRRIKDFVARKKDGVIVLFGCGLETTYYRCDNGSTEWYNLDLPDVIDYRKALLPEAEREHSIPGDAFSLEWLPKIREDHPDSPLLIVVSGVFYYFEKSKIVEMLRKLQGQGDIEVVFDVFNKSGMKRVHKYMEQAGHADAEMFFYVDDAAEFVKEIGGSAKLILDEKYYSHVDKKGLTVSTKFTMSGSDMLKIVKMIQISL